VQNPSAASAPDFNRLPRAIAVILAISAAAFGFLCWLLYGRQAPGHDSPAIMALPAVNAGLNALSSVFLVCGLRAILRRDVVRHWRFMVSAFISSSLFLTSYIIYHSFHGDTHFIGTGAIRPIYFFILISHITLSAVALPLILTSFYLALTRRFTLHPRVSRVTFPIWLYVSVTGVLVFLLLRYCNHA
jgi:putative membrane protein